LLILNKAINSWIFWRCIFQRLMIFLNRCLILWSLKIWRVTVNIIFTIIIVGCISVMHFRNKSLADSFQVLFNCLKMVSIKFILFIICLCFFSWFWDLRSKADNLFVIVWFLVITLLLLIVFFRVLRIPFFLIAFFNFQQIWSLLVGSNFRTAAINFMD